MPHHIRASRAIRLALMLAAFAAPALAQSPPSRRPPAPAAAPAAPELLTEANVTRDSLRAAYEAARLPSAVDPGGNLTVRVGNLQIYVLPGGDRIRLLVSHSFQPRATYQEKLDLANRINDGFIVVRAAIPADKPGDINLDHYVLLGPGVSRAALVAATRRFADVLVEAVGAVDTERLLK